MLGLGDTSILNFLEIHFDTFKSTAGLKTVQELWQEFKCGISHCIDKYVPSRVKKTNQTSPWITRDIIHMKIKIKRWRKKK